MLLFVLNFLRSSRYRRHRSSGLSSRSKQKRQPKTRLLLLLNLSQKSHTSFCVVESEPTHTYKKKKIRKKNTREKEKNVEVRVCLCCFFSVWKNTKQQTHTRVFSSLLFSSKSFPLSPSPLYYYYCYFFSHSLSLSLSQRETEESSRVYISREYSKWTSWTKRETVNCCGEKGIEFLCVCWMEKEKKTTQTTLTTKTRKMVKKPLLSFLTLFSSRKVEM